MSVGSVLYNKFLGSNAEVNCNPCYAAKAWIKIKKDLNFAKTDYSCEQAMELDGTTVCDTNSVDQGAGVYSPDCVKEKANAASLEPGSIMYEVVYKSKVPSGFGGQCSLAAMNSMNNAGQFADQTLGSAQRMDNEVLRLTPLIVGERSVWTASKKDAGSGVWGLVSNDILNPLEFDLMEKINCAFVSQGFYGVIDSVCYRGFIGNIQLTEGYMIFGIILWISAIIMKILWRTVVDNNEAKKKRGESIYEYKTRASVRASHAHEADDKAKKVEDIKHGNGEPHGVVPSPKKSEPKKDDSHMVGQDV